MQKKKLKYMNAYCLKPEMGGRYEQELHSIDRKLKLKIIE